QGETVLSSGCDSDDITQIHRHINCATLICSPRDDCTVVLQCQTVEVSRRDGNDIVQTRGRLTPKNATPRDDGAVVFQRQTVVTSCRDRDHVTQTCRHIGLASPVPSPRDYSPIVLQCQVVILTRRDGDGIVQAYG